MTAAHVFCGVANQNLDPLRTGLSQADLLDLDRLVDLSPVALIALLASVYIPTFACEG